MIVVIAGGRDLIQSPLHTSWLDNFHTIARIEGVVSGGAPGGDAIGEAWAKKRGIPVKVFRADWDRHGRAAGPLRNQKMAEFLLLYQRRAALLLPGGRGTESMKNCAQKLHIPVYEFPSLTVL